MSPADHPAQFAPTNPLADLLARCRAAEAKARDRDCPSEAEDWKTWGDALESLMESRP